MYSASILPTVSAIISPGASMPSSEDSDDPPSAIIGGAAVFLMVITCVACYCVCGQSKPGDKLAEASGVGVAEASAVGVVEDVEEGDMEAAKPPAYTGDMDQSSNLHDHLSQKDECSKI